MRIGIVSLDYPPDAVAGVARQRQALAQALARLGHDVHVVTTGVRSESLSDGGVTVHRHHTDRVHLFHAALPVLDRPLTDAQLLGEGVLDLQARVGLDIVDVPLWLAQPLALVRHAPCPVVVWLQTALLQLVELQQREPRAHERVLAECDRHALTHAAACIADSSSIVTEITRLYGTDGLAAKTALVYPGIDDWPLETGPAHAGVEALVVGRLEQRKGTVELCAALPRLLAAVPDLRVRFIGRDNSGADGFKRATGRTYPEAWAAAHPDLTGRVTFEGYVDDATLAQRLAAADVVLHPAHYESFGLVLIEAMRAGLPVVAFAAGGANEVFAGGDADGAVLVPAGQMEAFVDVTAALARDAGRRADLGAAGRRAFAARFTSERMARDTAAVYARVAAAAPDPAGARPPRLFHVMEALQDRDAVSRIARSNAGPLASLGAEPPVMALFAADAVRAETGRLRGLRPRPGDAALVHYWGYSRLERRIQNWPGPLALHYHNITPPEFFATSSAHYEMTRRGCAQLARIVDRFDLLIGDSSYNLEQLGRIVTHPRPGLCLYPVVDREALLAAPWDGNDAAVAHGGHEGPLWLFVGRMAPNKRQDDVMRAFDRFVAHTGSGRLALVGDMTTVPAYVEQLQALRGGLAHGARVTLVPSVPDAVLRGWYRAADVFVCASQHEGFCMPLAEAMAFDVPVVALDRGAVAETVGRGGVLVAEWDDEDVADRAAGLMTATARRTALVAHGRRRLEAFSSTAARERLAAAVQFLRDGTPSPLFITTATPHVAARETDTAWASSTNSS